ncbi:MAG: Mov34/MPN/PAD-1 family protein [Candidatus Thorarchaeota archaeon]
MKYEKDIILKIDNELLGEIKKCVDKSFPNEACGLIFGTISEHKINKNENNFIYRYIGHKFECIESSQKSPVAFIMNDYFNLIKMSDFYSKNYNYQLLSIFHSHPGGAYPSAIDIPYMESFHKSKTAKFKYLIWTIMDAKSKEFNGFIFIFGEIRQISVKFNKMR